MCWCNTLLLTNKKSESYSEMIICVLSTCHMKLGTAIVYWVGEVHLLIEMTVLSLQVHDQVTLKWNLSSV